MYKAGNYYTVANWQTVLDKIPRSNSDVFHRHDYHTAFARVERARCEAFVFEKGETIILLPYLRRSLNQHIPKTKHKNLYDVIGVYGYSGPTGVNFDSAQISAFMEEFSLYCASDGIVTSFIRLHPLLSQDYVMALSNLKTVNQIVVVPLAKDNAEILALFKHGVRKSIRKALEAGITVKRQDSIPIDLFYSIYAETMNRNNASDFYYFDRLFFESLSKISDIHTTYVAYLEEKPVSVEIVLRSSIIWHSFLGGTLTDHLTSSANTLLKYRALKDAAESGAEKFILGGGVNPGDGIHKYKQSFAPGENFEFNIQCNVHMDDGYQALIEEYEAGLPKDQPRSLLFQRYVVG